MRTAANFEYAFRGCPEKRFLLICAFSHAIDFLWKFVIFPDLDFLSLFTFLFKDLVLDIFVRPSVRLFFFFMASTRARGGTRADE